MGAICRGLNVLKLLQVQCCLFSSLIDCTLFHIHPISHLNWASMCAHGALINIVGIKVKSANNYELAFNFIQCSLKWEISSSFSNKTFP